MQNPYPSKRAVTRFESDLSPEQKVISVKKLGQRYKNIIMVGDGINDAPALAAADCRYCDGSSRYSGIS